jgi:hypothetical protein
MVRAMVEYKVLMIRSLAGFGLLIAACNGGGGGSTDTASGSTGAATEATDGTSTAPTTSGPTTSTTDPSGTGTATGTTSTTTGQTTGTTSDGETQGVDSSTGGTTTGPGTSTTFESSTGGTSGETTGETTGTTGDGSSSTGDTMGCVPTEMQEVTCDKLDNDCDGNVDNIDEGGDGICDCLTIGILGSPGFAPNSNFEMWLESKGSSVTRTSLMNNPDIVTPAFLMKYDLVLLDRIERALTPAEAAALGAFVKEEGRGLITLIGYNFDNNNPAPERDRANSALAPFGLAYVGGYFGNAVIPTFDQNHPISMGIFDVNFAGGIEPQDIGNQGTSEIFATWQALDAGLAHQTMMGGRVIVWGDEWITFDSDWQGYADVQQFWVNMVDWARPQDFCLVPQ